MDDPVVYALAGAIVTIAGLFYRHIQTQLADEKADAEYWRDKALQGIGLAEIATDQAERAAPSKRRTR